MVDQIHLFKRQFREINFHPWELQFKRPAKTSKTTLNVHRVLYISAQLPNGEFRWGEIAPLTHLSSEKVEECANWIHRWWNERVSFQDLPSSIKFGLECLLQPLFLQQKNFKAIPFNGLVWMNELDAMYSETKEKLIAGCPCIKLKVGALDFKSEWRLIHQLREEFGNTFILRLDANGAWSANEALQKLNELAPLNVHSIEQPIATRQWRDMAQLMRHSPIPLALDEELIGIYGEERRNMLEEIIPHYLVLKPTLHGGFASCDEWIQLANERQIQWWATSALESNLGLSHIFQWLQKYDLKMHQGLGTGALYQNNWRSPLVVSNFQMQWDEQSQWEAPWI